MTIDLLLYNFAKVQTIADRLVYKHAAMVLSTGLKSIPPRLDSQVSPRDKVEIEKRYKALVEGWSDMTPNAKRELWRRTSLNIKNFRITASIPKQRFVLSHRLER